MDIGWNPMNTRGSANVQILTRFFGVPLVLPKRLLLFWHPSPHALPPPTTKYWLEDVWGGVEGHTVRGERYFRKRCPEGVKVGWGQAPPLPSPPSSTLGGSVNLLSSIKERTESCGRLLWGGVWGGDSSQSTNETQDNGLLIAGLPSVLLDSVGGIKPPRSTSGRRCMKWKKSHVADKRSLSLLLSCLRAFSWLFAK